MAYKIEDIEGIGPEYAKKLEGAGIKTTDDLLEACCEPKGRKGTCETTGVSEKLLLDWANRADLMRLSGIGSEYSDLLEAAGVDTVKELRNRNAESLTSKLEEVNAARKLVRATPKLSSVREWIEQASKTEPKIRH